MSRLVRSRRRHRRCSGLGAVSLLLVLGTLAVRAAGQTVLPPDPAVSVGNVVPFDGFVDEDGRAFASLAGAADSRVWVVSPIYTRCPFTCTPITSALRSALEKSGLQGSQYRVVSFSFDPNETAEGLRAFRARMELPAPWLTLRAADAVALERTLRALDFRTITIGNGEFAHPNLIAILAPDQRLVKYLFGTTFAPTEIAAAVQRARSGAAFTEPREPYLFTGATLGLLLSSLVFFTLLSRHRARRLRVSARAD